ncbi:MAG: ABC transporter transmembrane domain-containing protein [Caldilineaceae bacterium]
MNNRGNTPPSFTPVSLLGSIFYILKLWRRHWRQALLILCLMTFLSPHKTYFAFMLKTIIDSLQTTGRVANLLLIILSLAGGAVISLGARLIVEQRIARIGATILNDLRVRMFKHLQQLSQGFYLRTPIGTLLARFSSDLVDIEKAAGSLNATSSRMGWKFFITILSSSTLIGSWPCSRCSCWRAWP